MKDGGQAWLDKKFSSRLQETFLCCVYWCGSTSIIHYELLLVAKIVDAEVRYRLKAIVMVHADICKVLILKPEMTGSVLCLSSNPSWSLWFSTLDDTIGITRLASRLAHADVIGFLPLLGVKKRAMDLRSTELGHTLFH